MKITKVQELRNKLKRRQGHLVNRTPPESDEERIEASNERDEHKILQLTGSCRKSSGRRRTALGKSEGL